MAVTGLRSTDVTWSMSDHDELHATGEEKLETLTDLVTNLFDVSMLQAGALAVTTAPLLVEDVMLEAIDELCLGPAAVRKAPRFVCTHR